MTEQYGMTKEEVKKLLELTDNRAVALAPEEFDAFYGSQPKELVTKFMDKNLNEKGRDSMMTYLQNILNSYRKIQTEKMKPRVRSSQAVWLLSHGSLCASTSCGRTH
eukprot:913137_1